MLGRECLMWPLATWRRKVIQAAVVEVLPPLSGKRHGRERHCASARCWTLAERPLAEDSLQTVRFAAMGLATEAHNASTSDRSTRLRGPMPTSAGESEAVVRLMSMFWPSTCTTHASPALSTIAPGNYWRP